MCGKNKSCLKRNYSISWNRDYQKQSLFFDDLQNQSHYVVCNFLKIRSVKGTEVLIAAEFQQRLRLRFAGCYNCMTEKGCLAETAHSLVDRACELWGNGLIRIDFILGQWGYFRWSLVALSNWIFHVYVMGRDFILLKIWSTVGFYTDFIKLLQRKSEQLEHMIHFCFERNQAIRLNML